MREGAGSIHRWYQSDLRAPGMHVRDDDLYGFWPRISRISRMGLANTGVQLGVTNPRVGIIREIRGQNLWPS